ncbi:MAG TPA: GNAT family N-acetyltransferase [Acidimicrobiia bacterium]|nr:GNAT family N-acetyltransferase [Acidimicrobiia bacterium]
MDTFEPLVTTRTATPDEYSRVIELTHEMYNATEIGVEDTTWERDAIAWIGEASKNGHAEAAVAFDSATNAIVASGIGIIYDDLPQPWLPNGKMGYIRWMSTTEDFRGYGVGEQVLNHLMNWFNEQGVVRVQLHATDKAIEFYSQHGFEKDSYTNMWWRKA